MKIYNKNLQWKFADLLKCFRKSINEGYLPENWYERKNISGSELIMIESGTRIAFTSDCVICYRKINSWKYVHEQIWTDNEGMWFSDHHGKYIEDGYEYYAKIYGRNGSYMDYFFDDDVVEFRGDYYFENTIGSFDIVQCYETDEYCYSGDLYYWESDGYYHNYEEEDEEDESIFSYHSVPRHFYPIKTASIGFEVEKNGFPMTQMCKEDIRDTTNWIIESDGSVSSGFELVSPTYDINDTEKILEDFEVLKEYINVNDTSNSGGHINYGIKYLSDVEIIEQIRAFIPIIYSMYYKRIGNTYCGAKKTKELNLDKYQSIRLRGNYVEFRIIRAVESLDQLIWRFRFFQFMTEMRGVTFSKLVLTMANKKHPLTQHMMKVYGNDSYKKMLRRAIKYNEQFNEQTLSQSVLNYISKKLANIA
jgi:hypothetical protein